MGTSGICQLPPSADELGFHDRRRAHRPAHRLVAVRHPGLAILLTVLAIKLVREGLNDAFNPRLRSQ